MQALKQLPQLCPASPAVLLVDGSTQVSRKAEHKASDDHVLNSHEINAVSLRLDRGPWAVSWR